MRPTIMIDRYAIRFENDKGASNFFFKDLFRFPDKGWQRNVLEVIHEYYEECVKDNIEPLKEDEN